jgi:DNA-directed RNA polymerase subunit RPC12/RpoP
MVKEYKRTCKNCGQVWHSLVSRERQLRVNKAAYGMQTVGGYMQQLGTCGMCGRHTAQTARNQDALGMELDRLQRCPNCGSKNYFEEIVDYG